MGKVKSLLTKRLFLVFIGLLILFLFLEIITISRSSAFGFGTWNLNQSIGGSSWMDRLFRGGNILWMFVLLACTLVYLFIRAIGKETSIIFSTIHIILALTYLLEPTHWMSVAWKYPELNATLVVLNLIYAFFSNNEADVSDDILDA